MKTIRFATFAAAFLMASSAFAAETLVIDGATVHPVTCSPDEDIGGSRSGCARAKSRTCRSARRGRWWA